MSASPLESIECDLSIQDDGDQTASVEELEKQIDKLTKVDTQWDQREFLIFFYEGQFPGRKDLGLDTICVFSL